MSAAHCGALHEEPAAEELLDHSGEARGRRR
jgi:hypothetical protein